MDDKNNENDFDDVDFEEFDDDFSDDDLLADEEISAGIDEFASDGDEFAADDDMEDDDWGGEEFGGDEDDAELNVKKGSSKKLLLPVVALVALAGGGGYYYTQIMNKSQSASQNQSVMPVQEAMSEPQPEMDIAIPMPSPITEPSDEEEFQQEPTHMSLADIENEFPANDAGSEPQDTPQPATQNQQPDVLTPMPNIASLDDGSLDNAPEPAHNDIAMDTPMDVSMDISMNSAPDISEPTEIPLMDNNSASLEITDTFVAPEIPEVESVSNKNAPVINTVDSQAMAEIENKNQALSSKVADMENVAQQKEQEISSLSSEVQSLKKKLEQSQSRIQELENAAKALKSAKAEAAQASAPKSNASEIKAQKSPTPAPQKGPAAKTADVKPQWELRSAQPGKAYVAIKGSNNVLVVETGDTLQGIGKIQSISVENGLWVVNGAQGKIVQ